MWKDLKARVLTAVVAIPLLLYFLWKGGILFLFLVILIGAVFIMEAAGLAKAAGASVKRWVLIPLLTVSLTAVMYMPDILPMILSLSFMLILGLSLISKVPGDEVVYSGFYFVYPFLGLSHALLVRQMDNGFVLIIYILVATFLSDTGAYFAGKVFGKHKLAPSISPAKSWEGVAGGVALSYISMIVAVKLLSGRWEFLWTFIFALGITFAGLAGDLVESALKRRAGVKDSGSFFPGHGGVMDRIDSLIFNIPFAFYFFKIIGGVF